jgi:hypothetical protein
VCEAYCLLNHYVHTLLAWALLYVHENQHSELIRTRARELLAHSTDHINMTYGNSLSRNDKLIQFTRPLRLPKGVSSGLQFHETQDIHQDRLPVKPIHPTHELTGRTSAFGRSKAGKTSESAPAR